MRLVPHATMPHPVKDVRVLSRITTEAFNQRRKTIRNSLGNLFSVEVLTGMGIDPAMRAENISVAQYCQMANYLAENALCRRVNDDQFAPSVYSGSKRLH